MAHLVIQEMEGAGEMLKKPPLFLSRRRQKTLGESKSGLSSVRQFSQFLTKPPDYQQSIVLYDKGRTFAFRSTDGAKNPSRPE